MTRRVHETKVAPRIGFATPVVAAGVERGA
jgi:hypothetical protein